MIKILIFPAVVLRNFAASRFLFWMSVILTAFFLGLYVFQVNLMVGETYSIEDFQGRIKDLSRENKILEINFSQTSSLPKAEAMIKGMGFEKTDKLSYVKIDRNYALSRNLSNSR